MPTYHADNATKRNRVSPRTQLKRLFVIMSTAPVPEPKSSRLPKPEKPSYLRYIEYV